MSITQNKNFLNSPKFLKALQKIKQNHQLDSEENFTPFPKEDELPIFNYGLLEALDKQELLKEWLPTLESKDSNGNSNVEISINATIDTSSRGGSGHDDDYESSTNLPEYSLLAEAEINYLQQKIQEMMETGDFSITREVTEGAELLKQKYLNNPSSKDGSNNGVDSGRNKNLDSLSSLINTNLSNSNLNDKDYLQFDNEAPSCEFTFEYDSNGKLVPTSNNIETQLNSINNDIKNLKTKLPPISDLDILDKTRNLHIGQSSQSAIKKLKSRKKTAKKAYDTDSNLLNDGTVCLFCEYEQIFGVKPKNMIKWFEEKLKKEEERKLEVRRKLENAKAKVMKKKSNIHQNPEMSATTVTTAPTNSSVATTVEADQIPSGSN